jgi:hypothetical protein
VKSGYIDDFALRDRIDKDILLSEIGEMFVQYDKIRTYSVLPQILKVNNVSEGDSGFP